MRINKLAPFYTEEDKQIYLDSRREYAQLMQKTRELNVAMNAAKLANDEKQHQKLQKEFDKAYIDYYNGAQMKWVLCQNEVLQRYIDSFAGSEAAILSDIQDVVKAVAKKDFLDYQKAMAEAGKPFMLESNGDVSEENRVAWEKRTARSWENCVHYLRMETDEQFRALEFYKFDTAGAIAILEAKASKLYTRTQKAATAEKTINAETAAASQQQELSSDWPFFVNCTALNRFWEVRTATKNNPIEIDLITGKGKVDAGNLTVLIEKFNEVKGLRQSTHQLHLYILYTFTNTGRKSRQVAFKIQDYMAIRDLHDKKSARKQLVEDLSTLKNTSLTYFSEGKKDKVSNNFYETELINAYGIENGVVYVKLEEDYYNILLKSPIMQFPPQLFSLKDNGPNTYAFNLLHRICWHKWINRNNPTNSYGDVISIDTLIAAIDLPKYDDVMKSDRRVGKRILDPLDRDLHCKQLEELFDCDLCHSKGKKLTQEELDNLDYHSFIKLYVKIKWKKGSPFYQDQEDRKKLLKATSH